MVHPLVEQMRFARAEFRRGLVGVTEEDAQAHLGPSNCISWSVEHMAWQEERYFATCPEERRWARLPACSVYGASSPARAGAWGDP